jgi:hypothetical protein
MNTMDTTDAFQDMLNAVGGWNFSGLKHFGEFDPRFDAYCRNVRRRLGYRVHVAETCPLLNTVQATLFVTCAGLSWPDYGVIYVKPNQRMAYVLLHETAHCLLRHKDSTPQVVAELEADAAALVVCKVAGLPTPHADGDYIRACGGIPSMLLRARSRVLWAARTMLREVVQR